MHINFINNVDQSTPKGESASIVVGCFQGNDHTQSSKKINDNTNGQINSAIENSRFDGKLGQIVEINAPQGMDTPRVIVVGLGTRNDMNTKKAQDVGGYICAHLKSKPQKSAICCLKGIEFDDLNNETFAAHVGYGALLRSWQFDKYKTKLKDSEKPAISHVNISIENSDTGMEAFADLQKIADGVDFAKTFVSEPPNVLYPETYAKRLQELSKLGVKVEVLGEKEMEELGMRALLGVGQGSACESKLVIMHWNGGGKDSQPVSFVGKGVTFDTGGISLKPSLNMHDMKYDMGGSGAVVGVMKALAGRKAKVNAIGVVGLVENMPDGNAQRPGDVVTSMSGQTIEILNTDAEGRLVLADALWYTQDRFKPQFMINLATLTGAIVIALGDQHAGLFSNNDELSERLCDAGQKTGECLWRLPLTSAYDKDINSTVADMQNIGSRKASSITAGQFLQRFVNDVPWAHLDIAGMAWADKALPVCEKGATGFGVRLLDQLIQDHYEEK